VLIDADNAQPAVIGELLAEVASYGTATVKRAYGDWSPPQLGRWKDVLHVHAIQPVQQFSYTSGKNATDSALIIQRLHAAGHSPAGGGPGCFWLRGAQDAQAVRGRLRLIHLYSDLAVQREPSAPAGRRSCRRPRVRWCQRSRPAQGARCRQSQQFKCGPEGGNHRSESGGRLGVAEPGG
jgi:hypothetical protein